MRHFWNILGDTFAIVVERIFYQWCSFVKSKGHPGRPGCCDNLRTCELRRINHFSVSIWDQSLVNLLCVDVVIGQTITLLYVKAADDPFFCTIAVALLHCGENCLSTQNTFYFGKSVGFLKNNLKNEHFARKRCEFFQFSNVQGAAFNDIQGLLLAAADEAKKAAPLVSIRPTNHRAAF